MRMGQSGNGISTSDNAIVGFTVTSTNIAVNDVTIDGVRVKETLLAMQKRIETLERIILEGRAAVRERVLRRDEIGGRYLDI